MIPRGSKTQFAFKFSEIVHIGAIADMAQFGLTKGPDDTIINLPFDRGKVRAGKCPLNAPQIIVETYEKFNYDLCYLFETFNLETPTDSRRNRSEIGITSGRIMRPIEALLWVSNWICADADNIQHDGTYGFSDDDRPNVLILQGSVRAIIHIANIAGRVAHALGVDNPCRRVIGDQDRRIADDVFKLANSLTE